MHHTECVAIKIEGKWEASGEQRTTEEIKATLLLVYINYFSKKKKKEILV